MDSGSDMSRNGYDSEYDSPWSEVASTEFDYMGMGFGIIQGALSLGSNLGMYGIRKARDTAQKLWHQNAIHMTYTTEVRRPCDLLDDEQLMANAQPIKLAVMRKASAGKVSKTPYVAWAHTHFQRHWASLVRGEFNGYGGTRAEQLCAARWLRLKLKEADVRDAHIACLIPMILSLALIPTVDEDAAAEFEGSPEFAAVTGRMSWIKRATRWCLRMKTPGARRTTYIQPR